MNEIVICDTNAAIHLAIICSESIQKPHPQYRLIIHPLVKAEIQKLQLVPAKVKRLGDILHFISKEVVSDPKYGLPSQEQEKLHQRIKLMESGLPPQTLSSGSSYEDRCFLIIARHNQAHLLTNEKTLHTLGQAYLGTDKTYRTSRAIEKLIELQIVTKDIVQKGLDKLPAYQERLHEECCIKLRELGFRI